MHEIIFRHEKTGFSEAIHHIQLIPRNGDKVCFEMNFYEVKYVSWNFTKFGLSNISVIIGELPEIISPISASQTPTARKPS